MERAPNCYRNYKGLPSEARSAEHSFGISAPIDYPQRIAVNSRTGGNLGLRIVLSNIGTLGDINPLIAIALEFKRRGHTPVMALPEVYRPRIEPLGLEFRTLRPDIDPTNTKLVEMIYDVNKGTETGLREFLFPVLRQTYDDLLDAATNPVRADLLVLGELNYAGPIVAWGRCNVTHACFDARELTARFPRGDGPCWRPSKFSSRATPWPGSKPAASNSKRNATAACFPPPIRRRPLSTA